MLLIRTFVYSHMNLCVLVYEPTIGRYVVPGLAKNATLIQEAAVCGSKYELGVSVAHVKHLSRCLYMFSPVNMLYMCYRRAQFLFGSA